MEVKFIADNNVGKLARWLRLIGYDTLLFKQKNDGQMIKTALSEDRVILTKDSQFMKRRLVTSSKLKAILIKRDDPKLQVQEVVQTLNLNYHFKPFSLCLECNQVLIAPPAIVSTGKVHTGRRWSRSYKTCKEGLAKIMLLPNVRLPRASIMAWIR